MYCESDMHCGFALGLLLSLKMPFTFTRHWLLSGQYPGLPLMSNFLICTVQFPFMHLAVSPAEGFGFDAWFCTHSLPFQQLFCGQQAELWESWENARCDLSWPKEACQV